ncbi:hypothetical protein PF008_g32599, partial [Phytophthora fragariae]
MRLTYILAVVIAATLHASGIALTTTKDSTHAAVSNVASKGIVHSLDVTEENDGRMLRKVHPKLGERQPQLGDFFAVQTHTERTASIRRDFLRYRRGRLRHHSRGGPSPGRKRKREG